MFCLVYLLVLHFNYIFYTFLVIVTEKTSILLRYLHQHWDKKVIMPFYTQSLHIFSFYMILVHCILYFRVIVCILFVEFAEKERPLPRRNWWGHSAPKKVADGCKRVQLGNFFPHLNMINNLMVRYYVAPFKRTTFED